MISYEPLWKTMREKHATTYTLQVKGNVSSSTIRRMKAGESVSTNTLDELCRLLNCRVEDVILKSDKEVYFLLQLWYNNLGDEKWQPDINSAKKK